ncbi:MAG: sulfotransferase [Desulfobacterales bacterium]
MKNLFKRTLPLRARTRLILCRDAIRTLGPLKGALALTRPAGTGSAIIVSGCPRSGTTWIAEVLNTIPDSNILYEPLYLRSNPILSEIGFRWRTYIRPDEDSPDIRYYFEQILTGKTLNPGTLSRADRNTVPGTRTWIVKFVRANMLMSWLVRQFEVPRPLVVIRHPCAVVSSQLRMGSWDHVTAPVECPEFFAEYPEFEKIRRKLRHLDEMLAFSWCLEYFLILKEQKPYPWLLLAYEDLLLNPEKRFSDIFRNFRHEISPEGFRLIGKDSSTTVDDGHSRHGARLTSWKRYLTAEQAERILNVTKAFGIDVYSTAAEPDYARLLDPGMVPAPSSPEKHPT